MNANFVPTALVQRKIDRAAIKSARLAAECAGSLGSPSKMPGASYGIPAAECITGTKLRSVEGSTCSKCYAYKRGNYGFSSVIASQYKRIDALRNDLEGWRDSMVAQIGAWAKTVPESERYFRWHDSGDLQSTEHLAAIVEIARQIPWVSFWIPTREYAMVRAFLVSGVIPRNLAIRLSAHMVDGKPPNIVAAGVTTSSVHASAPAVGNTCPAPTQGNACRDCRACWSRDVANVSYHVN